MTEEGKVKARVNRILDAHGLGVYRFMPVQSGMGAKSLDILICAYGRFVAIETKRPGKKPTALQQLCIDRIMAAKGIVMVIDGDEEGYANLDALLNTLRAAL